VGAIGANARQAVVTILALERLDVAAGVQTLGKRE
jgi:hypothetical protein